MYLMFRLGRPDVLPHTDLGIRKGVQRLDRLADLPAPKEVIERAAVWTPFKTLASWYLWRCLDLEDDQDFPS
jgi:DNA-3-methyladenine glycosylase II